MDEKQTEGHRTHSINKRNLAVIGGHIETSFLPWQRPRRITNQQFLIRRVLENKVKEILTFCSQNMVVNSAYET